MMCKYRPKNKYTWTQNQKIQNPQYTIENTLLWKGKCYRVQNRKITTEQNFKAKNK